MNKLMDKMGYNFRDAQLLETALSHSSYVNEKKKPRESNERLEFLGDSVLGVVVSDFIFENCPKLPEGDLTRLRAALVCEKSLCGFAKKLGLGEFLRMSHGETISGGQTRPSILADAFEAVIAAIYLDGGIENAREFVLSFVEPALKTVKIRNFKDYKTELQELVQKNRDDQLSYRLVGESGPEHNKIFKVEVCLNNNVVGKGEGHSKKESEQQAAKEALKLLGY